MESNVKEAIKNGVLLVLIVIFLIFFITTKGNDELNLNFNFPSAEQEFSYPVYASDYNGLYRNNAGNGIYAFVGKNADDTYRVYFIRTVRSIKTVTLKLDNIKLTDGKATFVDTSNTEVSNLKMDIKFDKNEFSVSPSQIGFSNAQLEGYYLKTKNISQFAMSEFEY